MSVQSLQMIDKVWRSLQHQIEDTRGQVALLHQRSERAETAGGVATVTFALLPTVNVGTGDLLWCSNGRKIGEGVGAGTGVIVYYNPGTLTWKRISDDSDVAI